ncbi:hypothetical protein SpCBS45565_g00617 [Spizellomyces sp. 'palustris']|nr:hypothetical protein SpCBS45565_g00617 [Spizellomyces sp. 'palustris']
MFPLLDAALNWSSTPSPSSSAHQSSGRFVLITDVVRADGSFLLHHFIGRHLRIEEGTGWNVVLVGLAQAFNHYLLIGKKLGVTLASYERKGRFTFLDGLSNARTASGPFANANAEVAPSIQQSAKRYPDVRNLFANILAAVSSNVQDGAKPCIVIDDLNMLLYSGVPLGDLLTCISSLNSYVAQHNGCLVVLVHNDTSSGDVRQAAMCKSLSHLADYVLEVQGLESGATQGLHGQLTLGRGPLLNDPSFSPHVLHYRLADSGVQFFKKGYSTGVL